MGNGMSDVAVSLLHAPRSVVAFPPPRALRRRPMAATDTSPSTGSLRAAGVSSTGLRPEESRVIWLLLAAAFVAILNETTMGVAIPHLITDLGITALQAQWLTTAFMLTMAVVIPITGFLLRRFTTRQMYIAAMSLFSLGTLIALLA